METDVEIVQRKSPRILPWIYIVMLYVTPLYTFIAPAVSRNSSSEAVGTISLILGIIMYIATSLLGIANCVMAWVNCRKDREDYLCGCLVILKYATIPFHVACAMLIFAGSMIIIFGGLILIILGMILQASVFIVGICYAWSYMVVIVRNGRKSKEWGVAHGLFLAVYVVDVIDTIVIMIRQKKYVIVSILVAICMVIGCIYYVIGMTPRP